MRSIWGNEACCTIDILFTPYWGNKVLGIDKRQLLLMERGLSVNIINGDKPRMQIIFIAIYKTSVGVKWREMANIAKGWESISRRRRRDL